MAGTSKLVKILIWYRSQLTPGGLAAPPTEEPHRYVSLTWMKLMAYVSYPDEQKILLVPCPKSNRKSAILNLVVIFGNLLSPYFNELLQKLSAQLQIWTVQSKGLHNEKLSYLWVCQMAWMWYGGHFAHFAMKHEVVITPPVHCPICLKLHKFDKSSGPKTSTCQYSVIVIVPPTGNRKWHVLPFDALLLEGDVDDT